MITIHKASLNVDTNLYQRRPRASVDASWRSGWVRHSDVPTLAKCIQLGLCVSLLTHFHRPPCSGTTCLVEIAWLGNLAGQGAVPIAGVHISCMGTYMVTLAVFLALHGDTHVS